MKRMMALALLLAAGCVGGSTTKEDEDVTLRERPPRPREFRPLVAITDFVNKTAAGQEQLGTAASDVLATGLLDSEQVRLIERQQLDKALQELKLQHTGITDSATAQSVGKMLNTKYVIYGVISNYSSRTERSGAWIVASKTNVVEVVVDVRIIEVATGEAVYGKTGKGKATMGATNTIVGGSSVTYDPGIAGKALRAAIYQMLDVMMDKME